MKIDRNAQPEHTERKILPAGTYRAKVESSIRKTSKSGAMMWEVQFSFPDEPDARWCYEYFVENEKNQWKFAQFYDSIGLDSDDTDDMKDIYGEEPLVSLVIETDPNYGDRNRIKRFLPLPDVDVEPAPDAKPAKTVRTKHNAGITPIKEEDLPF